MIRSKNLAVISICVMLLIPLALYSLQPEDTSTILEKNQENVIFFVCLGEGEEEISRGTGFVVGKEVMATSYHLVSQAKKAEGMNFKGKKVKIDGIISYDKNLNVAFLKINKKPPPFPVGKSDELESGKKVIVIGGNEAGEIRAYDGEIRSPLEYAPNRNIFDTNLTVSKDSSGGPVLNSDGQLVGMLIFLDSRTKFILPIDYMENLSKTGSVTKFKDWTPEDYFSTFEGAFLAGRIYYALGQTGSAEKSLKEVVKQNPNELDAHFMLADVYTKQRSYSSASSTYQKIIELDPNQDSAQMGLGMINLKMSRWKDAITPFETAVQINPKNGIAYFHIGNAYEELREFPNAVEAYKKYLNLNPENPGEAYSRMGLCQVELKDFEGAIVSFNETLKATPADVRINTKLAEAYQNVGQFDKAAEVYTLLTQISPEDSRIYFNTIIRMYDEAKMPDKAIESIQKMIEIDPTNTDLLYNLGYMYQKQEKYNEAIEAYNKVIEIDPNMEFAYLQLGYCYNLTKRHKDLVTVSEKFVKISPDSSDGWQNIGIGNMLQKRYSAAIAPLRKTIELNPDNGTAYYNLAICYLNIQDRNNAIELYKKLKDIDPGLANKLLEILSR